ncbi:MAG: bifunctional diaminohydroxyphosphoribosylaminopyrimidine deaminase/5-amino-6-(5-phosphoribosylamino)uracil reductase RibD [Taibaiella sp.]|nr:bifunctional diaminohydroxyphosphoribosylaminopyrimidine deaminase/5-amino-6-(5-phosphoribosylamino)uracil reductase RibD [Taibaiella sp.]
MKQVAKQKAMPDQVYMQHCLQLAQQAKGYTSPNPMVGAVLVHNGRIIGEGYHHFYGAAHAEVNCLDHVSPADKHLISDSTLYVNLEPCAHFGLTPPCASRVIAEQVKKVVIANTDPFERVSGRGIAMLRDAGIAVTAGIMEQEGLWVNRRFFCFHTRKRPYLIMKWAQTADGYIGAADSSPVQITGTESRQLLHKWRTEEAAIMVGFTTALNDNPQLIARHHTGRQPLRIALDRNLLLPRTNHLYSDEAATWLINEKDETSLGNLHYIKLPFDEHLLPALLQRLYAAHILSVIVEGGAQLLNSFITAGLWDEARVFTSNTHIGEGVVAPVLTNELAAMQAASGNDMLQVYTNRNVGYKYIPGMEL